MARAPNPGRNKELGLIHVLAAQAGLDDAAYREMLWAVARVKSARELDWPGRMRVIDHLKGRRRPAPATDVARMVAKVHALLAAAGRTEAYADALAARMFGVSFWGWLRPRQMHKLVAALQIDANRRGANHDHDGA